jgi:catechol 2,3-dioxygenase-like lactoylglutathione lyase family enzyme
MVQRLSHVTVNVLDQQAAKRFYVDLLGFEVRQENESQGFLWLTVGPKGQPDLDLVLMPITASPMMDAATADALRDLVQRGTFGIGVLVTDDLRRDYDALRTKGVVFRQPPTERPYGLEAVLQDNSGNWFALVEPKRP